MSIGLVLTVLVIGSFLTYLIYHNGDEKSYLLFVFYLFPFMELKVVPYEYGNLQVFDIITLLALLIKPKAFFRNLNPGSAYFILAMLFFTAIILSSIASEFPFRSLLSLIRITTPFIFATILIKTSSNDPQILKKIFKGLTITTFVALGFMIIQLIVGPERFTFYSMLNQNVMGEDKIRYPGFFPDSQLNGVFFGMTGLFLLADFKNSSKFPTSKLILFSVLLGGLLLTGSRSPMIGVAGGILFLAIFLSGNMKFQILRFAFVGGIFVIFAFVTTDTFKRFNQIDDSFDFRQNIWSGALDIFKENPVLGIGTNNYKDYVAKYAQDQSLVLDDNEVLYLDSPENGYLRILVEGGIITFSFLALILILPFFNLFRYFLEGYDLKLPIIAASSLICLLIATMSVDTLRDSRLIILLCSTIAVMDLFTKKNITFNEVR